MYYTKWSEFRTFTVVQCAKRCRSKSVLTYLLCFFCIIYRANFTLLHGVFVYAFLFEIVFFFCYFLLFYKIWMNNNKRMIISNKIPIKQKSIAPVSQRFWFDSRLGYFFHSVGNIHFLWWHTNQFDKYTISNLNYCSRTSRLSKEKSVH